MKARTRKLLSLLLTLCMVIGLLPGMALTASAAEADPGDLGQRERRCDAG